MEKDGAGGSLPRVLIRRQCRRCEQGDVPADGKDYVRDESSVSSVKFLFIWSSTEGIRTFGKLTRETQF